MSSDGDGSKKKRKLLILDLDGVICTKILKTLKNADLAQKAHIVLNNFYVFFTSGIKQFIDILMVKYDVAIFSSSVKTSSIQILIQLLSKKQFDKLAFTWFRDRCHLASNAGFETYKLLSDVWDNPDVNKSRLYSKANTIMIDDSVEKHRNNPKENMIFVNGDMFSIEPGFEDLLEKIESKFETLASLYA